eukprot:CAMPEP_0179088718 /NCGR_PEP_ID=MMETSP0796-20121207/40383_1 /TAXON_ID=73915 /ORGANISM="Pyrodinium bahamense, Strain pbaha01" /LENGTH=189 /DNA_ID=CAMNT_0020786255 /DNA_START=62 /DNA_END=629 /DNA_ORIENTATION=+
MATFRCCITLLCLRATLVLAQDHCLAQMQTSLTKAPSRLSEVPKHGSQQAAEITAATPRALLQVTAAEAAPNGPLFMNRTKMDQGTLPEASRHVNGKTETADWFNEYPTAPPLSLPVKNATAPKTSGADIAVPLMSVAAATGLALALASLWQFEDSSDHPRPLSVACSGGQGGVGAGPLSYRGLCARQG